MPTYDPTKPFDIRTNPNAPVAPDYVSSVQPGTQPIQRTILEGNQHHPGTVSADPAERFLDSFRAPESREQIVERKRQESQARIDSLNKMFDDRVAERRQVGLDRVKRDNALSIMTGNMGGSEAIHSRNRVDDANAKEIEAVNNERAVALQGVYAEISAAADSEAREQLMDATRSAEQILARRKEKQAGAIENLKLMASSGAVDFDVFKNTPENRNVYDFALQSVGGSEEALRAMFMLNRPREQILGTPQRIGNKYVQAYQNPMTGKVAYEQIDLPFDLPPEYSNFQKMGDNLVAIPDGWDGDVTKLKTIVGQKSTEDMLREQSLRMDIALKGKQLAEPGKGEVAQAEAGQAKAKADKLVDRALTAITDLRGTSGQGGAIGGGFQKTFLRKDTPEAGTKAASYLAKLDQVKALLSFPDLENMKGLGPMSEREFSAVQAAAGALNKDMSEAEFEAELTRIESRLNNIKLAGQLQPGEILVRDRASGQIGAINENEFDGSKYEPI